MRFGKNCFLKIINNYIVWAHCKSYLTKNATYSIAKDIDFNINIVIKVEILENQCLSKYLP